eukprot:CAMPEP_0114441478 /NCGR_PEP_ID=MMETSP0103-20121206/16396_1 /TAXON_ID=37642 ORGANISM="Paraphysomonas imperforata, Strain PA2" /NCGR_SAMPLE_ID=MMETSP0103 /ASSEMBLY_ACC=CAM_ASM_000201 /LENGTH=53 /DNA_ID=CAMNT_0001612595 /DNA_START=1 /DNA_END=159 /DNA_ORIENTATION=+
MSITTYSSTGNPYMSGASNNTLGGNMLSNLLQLTVETPLNGSSPSVVDAMDVN